MAELAGDLATALLRRVRDPHGTANDIFSVFVVLSHCQRFVNAATRAVLVEAILFRFPGNPFVQISHLTPPIQRVEQVRAFGRTLTRVDWTTYANHDPTWIKKRASLPLVWSPVGGDILCIWPSAIAPEACEVTVTGTKYTPDLTDPLQELELPSQHSPAILTMGEELLLLRQRLMSLSLKAAAERGVKNIQHGRAT